MTISISRKSCAQLLREPKVSEAKYQRSIISLTYFIMQKKS